VKSKASKILQVYIFPLFSLHSLLIPSFSLLFSPTYSSYLINISKEPRDFRSAGLSGQFLTPLRRGTINTGLPGDFFQHIGTWVEIRAYCPKQDSKIKNIYSPLSLPAAYKS
jgi:hypothetical protein